MASIPESFTKHPAQYNKCILEGALSRGWIPDGKIIDPFGGTGIRLNEILKSPTRTLVAIEIEPAYVDQWPEFLTLGDATQLLFENDSFDGAITSPAYAGVRFSDYNRPKAPSSWKGRRGYDLSAKYLSKDESYVLNNRNTASYVKATGTLDEYWVLHKQAWSELYRVLKKDGKFVFNYKPKLGDNGLQIHMELLKEVEFVYKDEFVVATGGYKFGANSDKRDPVGERVQLWVK